MTTITTTTTTSPSSALSHPAPGISLTHGAQLPSSSPGLSHRSSGLCFKTLFQGSDDASIAGARTNNYSLVLATQAGFYSPVHMHNFDQFRFLWRGGPLSIIDDMGDRGQLREGEVAYHPEGVRYGPQSDGPHERVVLVLQFGGASGQGYINVETLRAANAELAKTGRFEGGRYLPDGDESRAIDGYQALWEHMNAPKKLAYPAGRYKAPVLMRPDACAWVPIRGVNSQSSDSDGDVNADVVIGGGASGGNVTTRPVRAFRKHLGTFTEREVRVQALCLKAGAGEDGEKLEAQLEIEARDAVQLLVVRRGSGAVEGAQVMEESAIRLEPGAKAVIRSEEGMELMHWVLPTIHTDEE